MDPAFVENLKREYAGTVYYDRYINGLWVAAEGSIYRTFADNLEKFIITDEWLKAHPLSTATIGVDFGGNRSGHAFTLHRVYPWSAGDGDARGMVPQGRDHA